MFNIPFEPCRCLVQDQNLKLDCASRERDKEGIQCVPFVTSARLETRDCLRDETRVRIRQRSFLQVLFLLHQTIQYYLLTFTHVQTVVHAQYFTQHCANSHTQDEIEGVLLVEHAFSRFLLFFGFERHRERKLPRLHKTAHTPNLDHRLLSLFNQLLPWRV